MLSALSRIIDIAMVALGAAIAAAVPSGKFVWLDDMQSVSLAFGCLLVVVFFPALGIFLFLTFTFAWFSAYSFERPILALRPALNPKQAEKAAPALVTKGAPSA